MITEEQAGLLIGHLQGAMAFWAADAVELQRLAARATMHHDFDLAARLEAKIDRTITATRAARLAMQPSYLAGFFRWAWLRKTDVLGTDAMNFRSAVIEWHFIGQPDGLDCCPQCGSVAWANQQLPEMVPTPVGGMVPTGKIVELYRCTDCNHAERLRLDLLA